MSKPEETRILKVEQLKEGMQILGFCGFSKAYRPISAKTCAWLQHNFHGTTAVIARNKKKMTLPVAELSAGDELRQLFDFPEALKKFTNVTSRYVNELRKYGFLEFQIAKEAAPNPHKKRSINDRAQRFVEKAKESVIIREQAADAVQQMMDDARRGKVNADEVKVYIDQITKTASEDAMAAIASLKQSDQTYTHCVDAAAIFKTSYYAIKKLRGELSIFPEENMALLGGFMHDFGKAKVPKDILESTKRFERESKEMQLLQSHPLFGAELLASMGMPQSIVEMAKYHHVKMDTSMNSSYPKDVNYANVTMEARLTSIVDVYQALVGKRSYKPSWPPHAAIEYIGALAGVEFDPEVWDDFVKVMGRFPKGSLVELSDQTLAFVMSVPSEDLNAPQVVPVQDAEGELIAHQDLVDLSVVKDITIVKGLDPAEVFPDNALEIFTSIQLS